MSYNLKLTLAALAAATLSVSALRARSFWTLSSVGDGNIHHPLSKGLRQRLMQKVSNCAERHASSANETACIFFDLDDEPNALFVAPTLNFSFQIKELQQLVDPVHRPHCSFVFCVEVLQ